MSEVAHPVVYPYEVPPEVHPFAWMFLGFGLDAAQCNALAGHVFGRLGARWSEEAPEPVELRFAVNFPLELAEEHEHVTVGEEIRRVLAPQCGARIIEGHLPPGVKLLAHTGELVGTFTKSGIYRCRVAFGPSVKWDALGGVGGPNTPGEWIPVEADRAVITPDLSAHPASLEDMTDEQKAQALADLLAWEQAKATEARNGN